METHANWDYCQRSACCCRFGKKEHIGSLIILFLKENMDDQSIGKMLDRIYGAIQEDRYAYHILLCFKIVKSIWKCKCNIVTNVSFEIQNIHFSSDTFIQQ